jgi:hypothetical protein
MKRWSEIWKENKRLFIEWLCILILIITLFSFFQVSTYSEVWLSIVNWNLSWELSKNGMGYL